MDQLPWYPQNQQNVCPRGRLWWVVGLLFVDLYAATILVATAASSTLRPLLSNLFRDRVLC